MTDIDFLKDKELIAPDRNNKIAILQNELGRGGEGVIFTIKDYERAVAKIYYKDKRDNTREKKLKILIEKFKPHYKNYGKELAAPITRLYYKDEFVGFVMAKIKGRPLKIFLSGEKRLKALYKNATRLDLVELCIDFLKKVQFLHSLNILIGDINLNNVLADESNLSKCYLVDLDAVQVDNFPCPVGTDEFTPPNLQGKNFKNILRTKKDEYFSIAVMLFMILMIGKHPYSKQDGSSPAENIKHKNFSYPKDNSYTKLLKNAPKGFYKNLWTHFTKNLRTMFYETFAEDKRFTPEEWIEVLNKYKWSIQKGYFTNQLAPIAFKVYKNPVKVICEHCGIKFEIEEEYLKKLKNKKQKIYCNKCYDILYGIDMAKKQITDISQTHKNKVQHTINTTKTNKKIYTVSNSNLNKTAVNTGSILNYPNNIYTYNKTQTKPNTNTTINTTANITVNTTNTANYKHSQKTVNKQNKSSYNKIALKLFIFLIIMSIGIFWLLKNI